MGAVWRRWAISLVLLAGLLAGCRDDGDSSGAPSTTRSNTGSTTTSSSSPGPPSGLISTSFTDERTGWALSDEPCPRSGADQARCAVVSKTTDAGGSWTRVGRLDAPTDGAGGPDSVSAVHFADAQHGWAFYRSLFATFNGGKRWQRLDLGNPVAALDSAGSQAHALVGTCGDVVGNCTAPMRVFEGTIATGRWRFVNLGFDLPQTDAASLIVNQSAVYALVAGHGVQDQMFLARTTAGRWERRTPPCLRAVVEPIQDEDGLVAACRPTGPNQPVELQTSSDGGRSWALVWQYTFPSPLESLAVTGEAAIVGLENGDILRTADNGMTFATVLRAGERPGIRFFDPDHGLLTAGPERSRQLFRTTDAGVSWQPVKSPPGGGR
jgi:hypothetical protein